MFLPAALGQAGASSLMTPHPSRDVSRGSMPGLGVAVGKGEGEQGLSWPVLPPFASFLGRPMLCWPQRPTQEEGLGGTSRGPGAAREAGLSCEAQDRAACLTPHLGIRPGPRSAAAVPGLCSRGGRDADPSSAPVLAETSEGTPVGHTVLSSPLGKPTPLDLGSHFPVPSASSALIRHRPPSPSREMQALPEPQEFAREFAPP